MVHHDEYPGVSALGPRILAQEIDVQFLEWPLRLKPCSDSNLHPEAWRFGFLAHLATPDVFPYLDSHSWPIELASQGLQGLRHPTMASLGVRMSTLYQGVRQVLRNPQLPFGSFQFLVHLRITHALEDESAVHLEVRPPQQNRSSRIPVTPLDLSGLPR
ncbi:uncharacterized protein LOC119559644 [Drosophila subpulchrella]|uniref:uncharacterized protein LOC119559644 n=1 Tax=Drosophila subpulchrella TaxID=1486046 RepID=UPI0018A1973B|nr:uncharacterized protein LOC119559644 [Drosophila subpulchrella]